MRVVKVHYGIKIYYSELFGQYIVLLPKGNGNSEMHRFDSQEGEEGAENFIEENKPTYWWAKEG